MVVAPALEADSSHGVLRIGADVTAHCAVATPATLAGPASIRCSKNSAGAIAASVDGRRADRRRAAGDRSVGRRSERPSHRTSGVGPGADPHYSVLVSTRRVRS